MSSSGDARPFRDSLRRIFLHFFSQLLKAEGVARDVIGVVKIFVDDDVHHAQRERGVGARIDGQVPVGACRGARAIRIDHHQLRAIASRLFDERPQMNVVAVNVRRPGDDVSRMRGTAPARCRVLRREPTSVPLLLPPNRWCVPAGTRPDDERTAGPSKRRSERRVFRRKSREGWPRCRTRRGSC